MALSWTQKKAYMSQFIEENYAEALQNAGFVSYKNEGFHWYKVKNGLLYKVHLPIFSPSSPLFLIIGYGVIPLFTWESIAPPAPFRDWPEEMQRGYDHYIDAISALGYSFAERAVGKLPRESYSFSEIAHYLPNGLFIQHPNTELRGGEVFEELIFPVMGTLRSVEDVYAWNKANKLGLWDCSSEDEVIEKVASGGLYRDNRVYLLSNAFADECLHLRDEKLYPVLKMHLENYPEAGTQQRSKAEEMERRLSDEHRQIQLHAIESGDYSIFDKEAERTKIRMIEHIKAKLPGLDVNQARGKVLSK